MIIGRSLRQRPNHIDLQGTQTDCRDRALQMQSCCLFPIDAPKRRPRFPSIDDELSLDSQGHAMQQMPMAYLRTHPQSPLCPVGDLGDGVGDCHVDHDGNQEGFEVVEVQGRCQLGLRENVHNFDREPK